jgi:hypothetical protein
MHTSSRRGPTLVFLYLVVVASCQVFVGKVKAKQPSDCAGLHAGITASISSSYENSSVVIAFFVIE